MLLFLIYLAFVSLGLPDSLLGSAWPTMHLELAAPVAAGGAVAMLTTACTITSTLFADRLIRRLGTGRLVLFSTALTAVAIFAFSRATALWQLFVWAVPYGLGAGAIDTALNAYVALHYEARHMNWLHCMWGIGTSVGPAIVAASIAQGAGWQGGYRAVCLIQCCLVAALALGLGLWSQDRAAEGGAQDGSRSGLLRTPGFAWAMLGFLCYCALESSCGLWAATFMVLAKGVPAGNAAVYTSLFYIGITAGRAVSGLLTLKLDGHALQRLGTALIAAGIAVMVLGTTPVAVGAGLVVAGVGCAPIYPQMIALTPERFGEELAGSLMGPQMAAAYVGSLAFPPIAGLLIEGLSPAAFPVLAAGLLVVMAFSLERCDAVCRRSR